MGYTQKPHRDIRHVPVHISYRLAGSLPKAFIERVKAQRDEKLTFLRAQMKKSTVPEELRELRAAHYHVSASYEFEMDNALHRIRSGPMHLSRPAFRKEVMDSWLFFHENGTIELLALCVMSNHVHVVLRAPHGVDSVSARLLMKSHKGFTARNCNKLLGVCRVPFWHDSYHDREVRNGRFMRVMWYVLNNPVEAGLVERWEDWPGTWVNPEYVDLFRRQTA